MPMPRETRASGRPMIGRHQAMRPIPPMMTVGLMPVATAGTGTVHWGAGRWGGAAPGGNWGDMGQPGLAGAAAAAALAPRAAMAMDATAPMTADRIVPISPRVPVR